MIRTKGNLIAPSFCNCRIDVGEWFVDCCQ